jgi:hypothetical protein
VAKAGHKRAWQGSLSVVDLLVHELHRRRRMAMEGAVVGQARAEIPSCDFFGSKCVACIAVSTAPLTGRVRLDRADVAPARRGSKRLADSASTRALASRSSRLLPTAGYLDTGCIAPGPGPAPGAHATVRAWRC